MHQVQEHGNQLRTGQVMRIGNQGCPGVSPGHVRAADEGHQQGLQVQEELLPQEVLCACLCLFDHFVCSLRVYSLFPFVGGEIVS